MPRLVNFSSLPSSVIIFVFSFPSPVTASTVPPYTVSGRVRAVVCPMYGL